jgi:CBS domain containing-hemolysin-like protein
MRTYEANPNTPLRKIIRNMPTVPENMEINDILQKMIARRTTMIIVKDEYGGTSGIVTDKDIYEELFGSVRDEVDEVADDLVEKLGVNDAGEARYRVSGKMTLYDFERYFDDNIRAFDDSEMVTLTGYALEVLEDANVNATFDVNQYTFRVLDYKDAYINEFEVTVHAATSAE